MNTNPTSMSDTTLTHPEDPPLGTPPGSRFLILHDLIQQLPEEWDSGWSMTISATQANQLCDQQKELRVLRTRDAQWQAKYEHAMDLWAKQNVEKNEEFSFLAMKMAFMKEQMLRIEDHHGEDDGWREIARDAIKPWKEGE